MLSKFLGGVNMPKIVGIAPAMKPSKPLEVSTKRVWSAKLILARSLPKCYAGRPPLQMPLAFPIVHSLFNFIKPHPPFFPPINIDLRLCQSLARSLATAEFVHHGRLGHAILNLAR